MEVNTISKFTRKLLPIFEIIKLALIACVRKEGASLMFQQVGAGLN